MCTRDHNKFIRDIEGFSPASFSLSLQQNEAYKIKMNLVARPVKFLARFMLKAYCAGTQGVRFTTGSTRCWPRISLVG